MVKPSRTRDGRAFPTFARNFSRKPTEAMPGSELMYVENFNTKIAKKLVERGTLAMTIRKFLEYITSAQCDGRMNPQH
jgi:hypothetical protein